MYNRYIPQSDGSFRRSQVQESPPRPPQPRPEPCPPPEPERPPEAECHPKPERPSEEPRQNPPPRQRCPRANAFPPPRQNPRPPQPGPRTEPQQERNGGGIGSFLRQLLPKDFDTEDLLVVILLLLMSGNCAEDQNTALLTLALYLFM